MGNKHAGNQTFIGDFGKYYDLYKKWGYDFYEMEDRYENYTFRGFENYNILEERRRKWSYNDFGDRIAKMGHSGNIWRESYSGDGDYSVRPGKHAIMMAKKNASFREVPYFGTVLTALTERADIVTIILPVDNEREAEKVAGSVKRSVDVRGVLSVSFAKNGKKYTYSFKEGENGLILE